MIKLFEDYFSESSEEAKATEFADSIGLSMEVVGKPTSVEVGGYKRWQIDVKLSRNGKSITIEYLTKPNQKPANPTMLEVLKFLQKFEAGDYDDYLEMFDLEDNSFAQNIYNSVDSQFKKTKILFGDVMDELRKFI